MWYSNTSQIKDISISIDAENFFDKTQQFHDKNFLQIEEIFLNTAKTICEKPTAIIIINSEKVKSFFLDQG